MAHAAPILCCEPACSSHSAAVRLASVACRRSELSGCCCCRSFRSARFSSPRLAQPSCCCTSQRRESLPRASCGACCSPARLAGAPRGLFVQLSSMRNPYTCPRVLASECTALGVGSPAPSKPQALRRCSAHHGDSCVRETSLRSQGLLQVTPAIVAFAVDQRWPYALL